MTSSTWLMPLFLSGVDERTLSNRLRLEIPDILFIDGQTWETGSPPTVASIDECVDEFAYLWSPRLANPLPTFRRPDGRQTGPTSGVVIQLERSRLDGDELYSGSLAAGYSTLHQQAFASAVRKVTRAITKTGIFALDGTSAPYRAGLDALRWVAEQPDRLLRANNSFVAFLPRDLVGFRSAAARSVDD